MPWLVGDESGYQTVEIASDDFALAGLLPRTASQRSPLYLGYLLDGFSEALAGGRFNPARPPLAFRAGWRAVSVTARTDDPELRRRLGPYLAPTSPRPHSAAPLGMVLFSTAWLAQRLGDQAQRPLCGLGWAARLNGLLSESEPVFCDPVLELFLTGRSLQEAQACSYRHPSRWRKVQQAVGALWRPRESML